MRKTCKFGNFRENFLFTRLKDIFATGHDYLHSVNDRVFSPFREVLFSRNFASAILKVFHIAWYRTSPCDALPNGIAKQVKRKRLKSNAKLHHTAWNYVMVARAAFFTYSARKWLNGEIQSPASQLCSCRILKWVLYLTRNLQSVNYELSRWQMWPPLWFFWNT